MRHKISIMSSIKKHRHLLVYTNLNQSSSLPIIAINMSPINHNTLNEKLHTSLIQFSVIRKKLVLLLLVELCIVSHLLYFIEEANN